MIKQLLYTLGLKKKRPPKMYQSETDKVRHLVLPYCKGYGCDIGFGGDKVVKENCDGIDYAQPYAYTGNDPVDIPCDLFKEKIPVANGTYDYVYSSHLIEDFPDTTATLKEFIRLLKPGGNLVLVFPDQPKYEAHCRQTGQPVNTHHIHKNMGLALMYQRLDEIKGLSYTRLYDSNCEIDYNVIIAIKVTAWEA
ncbi:MAG TPA: methyltransferase domain-containing protein [Ferruginibacter sp.]|nr:methyltransferase domain-containing protein [Ferruginibacter sp.]